MVTWGKHVNVLLIFFFFVDKYNKQNNNLSPAHLTLFKKTVILYYSYVCGFSRFFYTVQ